MFRRGFSILSLLAAVAATAWSAVAAETIKVGVTPGPHAQIFEAVKPIAAKKGLDIQLIEFSDYVVPNEALNAGEIQANSFQNQPYLDNQKADRGYKIESVGLTVNFPIGVYSKRHKDWAKIPDGGTISFADNGVAIPNCGAQPVDGNGKATCTVTYPAIGTHVVTALYTGSSDGAFAGSTNGPGFPPSDAVKATTARAVGNN